MTDYVLDKDQPISATKVQIFDAGGYVILTGPDSPGKIAIHLAQYVNLEVDDTVMVIPHIPGERAEETLARVSPEIEGNEFRDFMSEEMRTLRDKFLRDIEDHVDA